MVARDRESRALSFAVCSITASRLRGFVPPGSEPRRTRGGICVAGGLGAQRYRDHEVDLCCEAPHLQAPQCRAFQRCVLRPRRGTGPRRRPAGNASAQFLRVAGPAGHAGGAHGTGRQLQRVGRGYRIHATLWFFLPGAALARRCVPLHRHRQSLQCRSDDEERHILGSQLRNAHPAFRGGGRVAGPDGRRQRFHRHRYRERRISRRLQAFRQPGRDARPWLGQARRNRYVRKPAGARPVEFFPADCAHGLCHHFRRGRPETAVSRSARSAFRRAGLDDTR